MTDEPRPTKAEIAAIGVEMMRTLGPILEKYPGMHVALAYAVPREDPSQFGMSVASTEMDPRRLLTMLVHTAHDVKTMLIDPYYHELYPEEPA